MNTARSITKKLIDKLSSFYLSFAAYKNEQNVFFSPVNSLESINLQDELFNNDSLLDSMILEKTIENNSLVNECRNISDFDILSFVAESEKCEFGNFKQIINEKDKIIENLKLKVEKICKRENFLKKHMVCLENDLFNSNERVKAYKEIAIEKIDLLNFENQRLRKCFEEEKKINNELDIKITEQQRNIEELENLMLSLNINNKTNIDENINDKEKDSTDEKINFQEKLVNYGDITNECSFI
ncbi:hypothetical protein GVAV_000298 [Gurleya vavrai]